MATGLDLEFGDPELKPASYSRFVLPFAYEKSKCESEIRDSCYQAVTARPGSAFARSAYHRKYLTFETSEVLYERAQWLELHQEGRPVEQSFELHRPGGAGSEKSIPVTMAPPVVVLFEWGDANEAQTEKIEQHADVFSTAFLVLELHFRAPTSLEDLCWVNELFRYWYQPFEEHLQLKGGDRALREVAPNPADTYFDRWADLLSFPCKVGDQVFRLVSNPSLDQARAWKDTGKNRGGSGWIVYSDPRTFVWTCAVAIESGSGAAKPFWPRLLNVDSPELGTPSKFEEEWAEERTYPRWREKGSLYGFTLHSGAALLPPIEEPPLWRHFRESYFDQTLLLLYTRVSLFRISRRLSDVSAEARDASGTGIERRLRKDLTCIRKCLTLFANLYQFPLLSNQQQGIELYTLAHKVMDIELLSSELDQQVTGSHELLEVLSDQDEALAARRLNVVAAGGLAMGVATGFLGMNVIAEKLPEHGLFATFCAGNREWVVFGLTTLLSFGLLWLGCWKWEFFERLLFSDSDGKKR